LGAEGGGVRRDVIAFLGQEDRALQLRSNSDATLRPVVANADDPPTIEQLPMIAPDAGARPGRIDRVWLASSVVRDNRSLSATAQFTDHGVQIHADNQIGSDVDAPLLLWNRHCFRCPRLPSGQSNFILGEKNPAGDFTNVSMLTGEAAALQAAFVELAAAPRRDPSPLLAGWINQGSSGIAQELITFSTPLHMMREQFLLSAPLRVAPSPPSATISIPADFNTIVTPAGRGVFYDSAQGQWLHAMQVGSWMVGFKPPAPIGKLTLRRAAIHVDINAPNHTLVLRKGQCRDGTVAENSDGPVVAQWQQVTGDRDCTVELDLNDFDQDGCLWLRLNVEQTAEQNTAVGAELPRWKFNEFAVGLEAIAQSEAKP
jgi:hypothetical protein